MRIEVNIDMCIGCGTCADELPEVFSMTESCACSLRYSEPHEDDTVREIIKNCPAGAIEEI